MEIMLSHLGVGVAYDALDGLDIHAQCLHLRHIGVAAAVRREQADIARFFQRFAKYIPEMGGVAGQAGLGAFPDELVGGIPQLDGTRADIQRHRNIPDTVFGFRTADADCTFYDLYCLPDVNDRAIFFNPFKLKKELPRLPGYIIVTLWTAFIFCMIGWIILASLSTTKEIFTGSLLASGLHFENYTKALFTNKAALNLLNSVIYTVPSCILIIVVCAPAAYCMSRFKFRGAGLIQALIIIGLAIPNIMIVMPLFSIVSALNLSGTHFTLIFLYTACSVPYTTFFLLTFFKGISTSFEEAAAIDGCGPIQCFWKIMFPLAQPAIVTVSIFNFIGKWNEYFMALIFANKSNLRPIGVGLYQTVTSMMNSGDWAGMFASVVIVFIPTVVIYAFLSDKIISGVTAGGNKG